jgi:ribonuclease HI
MTNQSEKPLILLYTDGGAEPNPGRGGYGVVLSHKGRKKEFSAGFQMTTNNRMELLAVISGLQKLKVISHVKVYSDSRYVVDGIEKGWAKKWRSKGWMRSGKGKAINPDLWARLLDLVEHHEVQFHWVKGHAGHPENERCDELASRAMRSSNLKPDPGFLG